MARALDGTLPTTSAAAARRALTLRSSGRPEEAVALLREPCALGKAPPWAHAVLGESLRDVGGRLLGLSEVQRFLALDPEAAGAAALERELGDRREAAWVHGCLGAAARAAGDLEAARRRLERALELDAGCGWAWGWLGEALLRSEKPAEALPALNRAVALFAEWSQALAWRAEVHAALGDRAASLRDLDHAVALGQRDCGALVRRAQARLESGDAAGYESDLRAAVREAPERFREQARSLGGAQGRAVGAAIAAAERARDLLARAETATREGRRERALELASQALQADPGHAAALLARAEALEGLRRFTEAQEAADEAARAGPGARAYAVRARISRQLGYLEAALRDASVALTLAPDARLLHWRAEVFLGMRHYDLALKDVSAALELSPDDGGLYDLRAHVNLILGRAGEARRDVERALAIAPGHLSLRLRQAQLLALQGRAAEARKVAASLRRAHPAWSAFLTGYVACVSRDYEEGARGFERAVALAGKDEGLRAQAALYAPAARGLAAVGTGDSMRRAKAAAAAKGQVYMCGLGVFPPRTATVEVLQAITECDVIFNNLPGIGMSEFLGLFCKRRRPVAFRYEQDAALCADLVLSEVKAGKTVGFVTFGHPLLFGPLSHNLIKRCRAEGIAWKAFGAVSSMDAALAGAGMVLGYSYPGFQVFEITSETGLAHVERASNKLPMVVYFADGMGEDGLRSLLGVLRRLFPKTHRCLLFGPKLELSRAESEGVSLEELGSVPQHKLGQGVLFVPPVEA